MGLAVARPKEFDKDEVLRKAIQVFASHGYEGASTEALLGAMGVSRQSMYDTFGDKRQLYLEALQRYTSESTAEIIGAMFAESSAFQGLENALMAFAARPAARPQDGCLGISATTEFGRSDRAVAAITDASASTLATAFERIIRKGQAAGEVASDLDPRAAALFLSSTLAGLKVSARAGARHAALRDTVRIALRSLR
jgi:TetR/AcrR family transcriptional regulator, transcriptional repressor for nem operon